MILGIDISTSVIGMALFSEDFRLQELCYIKFKQGKNTNLFIKLDEFIEFFENKFGGLKITNIHIEEPLKKFKGKFSNADTIQKLTQMNSLVSGFLYKRLNVQPLYFNVNTARSIVFPDLHIPQKHPKKKYLVWESVMKMEPTINWKYSERTHKLADENFDMCDAYVAGMAGIVMLIKQQTADVVKL